MIELTDEIRRAYAEAWYRTIGMEDQDAARAADLEVGDPMPWRDAALKAVLAIVERNCNMRPNPAVPEPAPCAEETWSWEHFTPGQLDAYWIRCTRQGPHDEHKDEHTGLTWVGQAETSTETEATSGGEPRDPSPHRQVRGIVLGYPVMTAAEPLRVGDVVFHNDGLGGLDAYRGPTRIGMCSPWASADPDGDWYARRFGRNRPAERCKSRQDAIHYLAQENPDAR